MPPMPPLPQAAAEPDPLDPSAGDFIDIDLKELNRKAYEAYNSGLYLDAARAYLALLELNITDASAIYNLACCYGVLGEGPLAASYLVRSVRAGFENIDHMQRDPDFNKVRGTPRFDGVVDSIAAAFEKRESAQENVGFLMTPSLLPYRIHFPAGYDAESSRTLVVGLHGFGSDPDNFSGLWEGFGEADFIFAAPQAPYPFAVGSAVGFSWRLHNAGEDDKERSARAAERYVVELVNHLKNEHLIDAVFLLGFSQGGAHTYTVGIRHHEIFDGMISFGGWLEMEKLQQDEIERANHSRVFISHGSEDRVVDFEAGSQARSILSDAGYDVTFSSFEGGHRVPEEELRKVVEWLSKSPALHP